MNLNGQFFNPNFDGEGFYLTEQDGRLIGAYFTYTFSGEPTWYVFDCQRIGDTYSGDVIKAEGGSIAAPSNPQNVVRKKAGIISFVKDVTWTFDANIGGVSVGYPLTKLFPVDEVEPPVEPPVEPEPGIPGLKLEEYRANVWNDAEVPLTGQRVIHRPDADGNNHLLGQFKISAEAGHEFKITEVTARGPANPRIEQISVGDIVKPGEHIICRLKADNTNGERVYPEFRVSTEQGEIINLVVRLSTG